MDALGLNFAVDALRQSCAGLYELDVRRCEYSRHVTLQGCAGTGVSYMGSALLLSHFGKGGSGWAIRWAAARTFDDILGVETRYVGAEGGGSINPLGLLSSDGELESMEGILVEWLYALCGDDEPRAQSVEGFKERELVGVALKSAWKGNPGRVGMEAVLCELARTGDQGRALAKRIKDVTKDVHPSAFEGRCSVDPEERYVSFVPRCSNDANLAGETAVAKTLLALHAVSIFLADRAVEKMLLVDENAMLGKDGSRLLLHCMRFARSMGCAFVAGGHPIAPLAEHASEIEACLLECSRTRLFLGMTAESWCAWQQQLPVLQELHPRWDGSCNRRLQGAEVVWVQNGAAVCMQVGTSPILQVLLGSDYSVWKAYSAARAEGVGAIEAAALVQAGGEGE
ncbi:hypothetical protein [Ottowia sp.]|uniref:hypothetical protein n=1 Tax=Ottowia sp. TaxID=1898956 RepID=UPI0025F8052C|nr:hypothetical protein [Ottowia sp.]MBK6616231.1 hypothetical protein [Ottowia sp.]